MFFANRCIGREDSFKLSSDKVIFNNELSKIKKIKSRITTARTSSFRGRNKLVLSNSLLRGGRAILSKSHYIYRNGKEDSEEV